MEKMAFLFPGLGCQFVGMSKSFYDQYEIARRTFEEANDILGFDLGKICFDGSLSDLVKSEIAQPAVFVSSVVAFRVYLQEIGIAPQFCAGHSLGEYSALTCVGAIKFSDALEIIKYRVFLTEEIAASGIGTMTIIDGVERSRVEEECKKVSGAGKFVGISCYNSPHQTDICGCEEAVSQVEEILLTEGCQVTPLIASAPFHSPLMQSAADKLKAELAKYAYFWFDYPVISNSDARPYSEPEGMEDRLALHLVKPVQWQSTMEYLKKKGITMTVEMGPKNVLSNLVKANVEGIQALCFAQKDDRLALLKLHEEYPKLKKHIPTVITKCLAIGVATPNKNWDNEEYAAGVIKPYKRIQAIQEQLDQDGTSPTLAQMKEALELLKTIFKTKKLPVEEQVQWFNHIINVTGTYYELGDFVAYA